MMLLDELDLYEPDIDMTLDAGIRDYVLILRSGGIETFESCDGSDGHCFPVPTIRGISGVRYCRDSRASCRLFATLLQRIR